ncbi:MAG TPA: DnaA/Hda family protein [Planctomycetota bacterium]|nr:ATP-binding protein [Planctomycetota bacterium]OQC22315.1 MAG: Chromosomal replication initiator protein DnaA [Planctomycetes bacterium ADurb.Bin069]HNS00619.1 DnaA/Hda family protein [Planctomycetota bacterium]HNU26728.1 DnaA/Hda family protein [Planctomycetota bacterium]HOE29234.1 DnaA/Hda family protein [Planctomycetota bacterium]
MERSEVAAIETASEIGRAWDEVRAALLRAVGAQRFQHWLDRLAPVRHENGTLTLGTPNRFVLEWIESRYLAEIAKAVRAAFGEGTEVKLAVSGALFSRERAAAPRPPDAPRAARHRRLDAFVPGASNRAAYRAVTQLLHDPRFAFNPLVMYGASGTGKTHLLQGLASAYRQEKPRQKTACVTGDEFSGAFRANLRQKQIKRFRAYYRSLDLFVVDDFQHLAGKQQTQQEFLHTFDALCNRGGRVVIASGSHPGDLAGIGDRLRQRLVAGLVVKLSTPDFRARLAILRNENARMRRQLPEDVLVYLARRVTRNMRDLIGGVTRLGAYASLEGRMIGLEEARTLLADQLDGGTGKDDLGAQIIAEVCRQCDVGAEDFGGASRRRRLVSARKLAMYLLRAHGDFSLREIGALVGGRKASTVRSALRDVEAELAREGPAAAAAARIAGALGLGA